MTRAGNVVCHPSPAPIDAYGNGGFRFAAMSHVGSLLCLPSGIYAWDAGSAADITLASLDRLFDNADLIDVLLVGTGPKQVFLKPELIDRFKEAKIVAEPMATGAAARTYNVLLSERRNVAAALIAVGESAANGTHAHDNNS